MPSSPKVKKDIGYVLRVWRAERDLTCSQAAKRFKISASHWSLLEDGKRHASPELADALAQATSAPLKLFLGLQETL